MKNNILGHRATEKMNKYNALNLTPLFATPVGQIDLPNAEQINAGLAAYILDCEKKRTRRGTADQRTKRLAVSAGVSWTKNT